MQSKLKFKNTEIISVAVLVRTEFTRWMRDGSFSRFREDLFGCRRRIHTLISCIELHWNQLAKSSWIGIRIIILLKSNKPHFHQAAWFPALNRVRIKCCKVDYSLMKTLIVADWEQTSYKFLSTGRLGMCQTLTGNSAKSVKKIKLLKSV